MISWDDDKRFKVLRERGIDFSDLNKLLSQPYIEDQKNDDPEQYRIIGKLGEAYLTFIVEYEQDQLGEFIWVVTAWNSTQQERENYEKEIGAEFKNYNEY